LKILKDEYLENMDLEEIVLNQGRPILIASPEKPPLASDNHFLLQRLMANDDNRSTTDKNHTN
jgi:hypothetical protein